MALILSKKGLPLIIVHTIDIRPQEFNLNNLREGIFLKTLSAMKSKNR